MSILNLFKKPTESFEYHTFKVVGVTFKNGRKSRQTILRQIKFHDEPFNKQIDVKIEAYDYEGETALGVYANNEQLGNIAKNEISYFLDNKHRFVCVSNLEIVGGGDIDFGARVTVKLNK